MKIPKNPFPQITLLMQKAFWSDYIPFVEDITQLAADTFPKEDEEEE